MSSSKLVSTTSTFLFAALVVSSTSVSAKDTAGGHEFKKKPNLRIWEKVIPAKSDRDKEADILGDFARDFSLFYACQAEDAEWYLRRTLEHVKTNVALDPDVRKISTSAKSLKKDMLAQVKNKNSSIEEYYENVSDFAIEVAKAVAEAKTRKPAPKMNAPLGGTHGLLAQIGRKDLLETWNSGLLSKLPSASLRARHCDSKVSVEDRERATTDHGKLVRKAIPVHGKTPATVVADKPAAKKSAVAQKPVENENDFIPLEADLNANKKPEEKKVEEKKTVAVEQKPVEVAKPKVEAAKPKEETKVAAQPSQSQSASKPSSSGISKETRKRWIADTEKILAQAKKDGNTQLIKEQTARLKKQQEELAKMP
jgi:hypothetical protein